MNKENLLNRIDAEWKAFLQSFEGLPDDVLRQPNVVGVWPIHDVLGHISTWEEETMQALPLILNKKPVPRYSQYGGVDAFNAREHKKKQNLSVHQIKKDLKDTHNRLIAQLSNIPDTNYSERRLLNRIRLDTYNHYHEHTQQINHWKSLHGL